MFHDGSQQDQLNSGGGGHTREAMGRGNTTTLFGAFKSASTKRLVFAGHGEKTFG